MERVSVLLADALKQKNIDSNIAEFFGSILDTQEASLSKIEQDLEKAEADFATPGDQTGRA